MEHGSSGLTGWDGTNRVSGGSRTVVPVQILYPLDSIGSMTRVQTQPLPVLRTFACCLELTRMGKVARAAKGRGRTTQRGMDMGHSLSFALRPLHSTGSRRPTSMVHSQWMRRCGVSPCLAPHGGEGFPHGSTRQPINPSPSGSSSRLRAFACALSPLCVHRGSRKIISSLRCGDPARRWSDPLPSPRRGIGRGRWC